MRVAILAPTAGPAFDSADSAPVGGAERQLAMLGRALKARGHEVDVLGAGSAASSIESDAGRLWRRFPLSGPPVLKLFHPKGSTVYRFLRERGSDLLIQRGASELTALGAGAAALAGLPFVFMIASDLDLDQGREILPHPQDRVLFHESLRSVGLLVAQTKSQARQLWRAYGLQATVQPSFLAGDVGLVTTPSRGRALIWGGNIRPVKRPEWLLQLARRFPDEQFIVYGAAAAGSEAYAARIIAELRARPNVEYLGRVAESQLMDIFPRARILINSSEAEGFPNTFLEAWRHGLRILASVDPDGLLERRNLGLQADSLGGMVSGLRRLLTEEEEQRGRAARRAASYLQSEHGFEDLARSWERLLSRLLGARAMV